MSNFIFKSQGLIKNVDNKLNMVLTELRFQRSEHAVLLRLLNILTTDKNLQKQVDEYFDDTEDNSRFEEKKPE